MESKYIDLSIKFLDSSKRNLDVHDVIKEYESLEVENLIYELDTDRKKLVFWINTYNAMIQYYGKLRKDEFELKKLKFFDISMIKVGRKMYSFNQIEHGVLRKSQWKYGLGYVKRWFPNQTEKLLRVNRLDARIHFLLNCGAESCPIIRPLNLDNLEKELEESRVDFVKSETKFDHDKKVMITSKIMFFYLADFGGSRGVKEQISFVHNQDFSSYQLKYSNYNWDLKFDNY